MLTHSSRTASAHALDGVADARDLARFVHEGQRSAPVVLTYDDDVAEWLAAELRGVADVFLLSESLVGALREGFVRVPGVDEVIAIGRDVDGRVPELAAAGVGDADAVAALARRLKPVRSVTRRVPAAPPVPAAAPEPLVVRTADCAVRVETDQQASDLVARLGDRTRTFPIVVVTVPNGRETPWTDADAVAREVAGLAEVYLVRTGAHTYRLSDAFGTMQAVFGGASRVYSADQCWREDPFTSRLHFAHSAAEGARAVDELVDEVLRQARPQEADPAAARREVRGVVKALVTDQQALVALDGGGLAVLAAGTVVPGMTIGRLVRAGQVLDGAYDEESRRLDVGAAVREPADALVEAGVGCVILARAEDVASESMTLVPFPGERVKVGIKQVTGNEADRLTDLVTEGEVLRVRVVGRDPLRLSALDVDDDEPVLPAPSVLPGGPPWLAEDDPAVLTAVRPTAEGAGRAAEPVIEPDEQETPGTDIGLEQDTEPEAASEPVTLRPVPGPGGRPRMVPVPASLTAPSSGADAGSQVGRVGTPGRLRAENDQLRATIKALREKLASARAVAGAYASERDLVQEQVAQLEATIEARDAELADLRRKNREARKPARALPESLAHGFTEPEQQLRWDVLRTWVERTPAGDKEAWRLPAEWRVGEGFLASMENLQGIPRDKVLEVVVQVLTGQARKMPAREWHALRTGEAGNAPQLRRPDGALAFRVSMQRNTPSARRLHFWMLDGVVELAKVGVHDDLTI